MIFPTGPMLSAMLTRMPEDNTVINMMLEGLRQRGRQGLSSLPPRQSGAMTNEANRVSLVLEGLIPAPHEVKTKLVYRAGLGHGMPCLVEVKEEAIIAEKESPFGGQRQRTISSRLWVSLHGSYPDSLMAGLVGQPLSRAIERYEPIDMLMEHVITSVESQNNITQFHLDSSDWTSQIEEGQIAEGATSSLIGLDPNI